MAAFYLLNTIQEGNVLHRAGSVIDSVSQDITALAALGAVLWPVASDSVGAAIVRMNALRARGGAPTSDAEASLALSLAAQSVAGVGTGENSAYATQAVWYIDPVLGVDSNTGLASTTALKTWSEYVRRVGVAPYIRNRVDIYLLGDMPSTDPVVLRPVLHPNGFLYIHGTKTVVATGVLTAVTARAVATNTSLSGADTTTPTVWTSHVGRLVEITASGTPARVGAAWWVAKDLGANTARFTTAATEILETSGTPSLTEVTPAAGDVFAIYTLSKIAQFDIIATHGRSLTAGLSRVIIEYVNIIDETGLSKQSNCSSVVYTGARVWMSRCGFGTVMFLTNIICHNSLFGAASNPQFGSSASSGYSTTTIVAGGSITIFTVALFTKLRLLAGALFQSTGLFTIASPVGVLEVQDAGWMDWGAGPAMRIIAGATLYLGVVNGGVGRLWGTSAVAGTYAVQVHSGKLVLGTAGGTAPTIAGALTATQDFRVRGQVAGPAFDTTTNLWTIPGVNRAYTWANLALAVAAVGFGGNAVDPTSGWGVFTEAV